jgi:hypothetical protein
MYVLDFLPPSVGKGHKNAVVFTAGWAMKLVPLIGKILSQLVIDGATPYEISQFKITRKGNPEIAKAVTINYVIVGAGASGLYTALRLLRDGNLQPGDTVQVYEWSHRPGGRIYTYTFPPDLGGNGLYCEFGGMRFATDPGFPDKTTEGHVLVQNMILNLGLEGKAVPFLESSSRLYYLRGVNVYENDITTLAGLPYKFNNEFVNFIAANKVPTPYTADNILGAIASLFAPNLGSPNSDRPKWCSYYAHGEVTAQNATPSFPAGTRVHDMGYWNLLYDQFGDEGFDYSADGTGYTSNVINWNSADAMQANNDYGSGVKYMRPDGGYGLLFDAHGRERSRVGGQLSRIRHFLRSAVAGVDRIGRG